MTIQNFLEQREIVGMDDLTRIASDPKSHGEDIIEAFRRQSELRQASMTKIIKDAETANRTDLLASEQRAFDRADRERDQVLALQRQVEARTASAYQVPASQAPAIRTTDSATDEPMVTVPKGVTMRSWLEGRRPELKNQRASFGRVVAAWLTGKRDGLNALEQRALSEGSDAAGGYTVPEVLAASWIDSVRNAAVCFRAGAVTVPMTSDTLSIARLKTFDADGGSPVVATKPSWKSENADIDEASLELERVQFKAKTLPILLTMSVELQEDSNNIDAIVEQALAQACGLELDRAALLGSGSDPEPKGIVNQDGVDVDTLGSPATVDYDTLIDMIGAVTAANHTPNARMYPASIATALAKLKASSDGQYLRTPDAVAAVTPYITNSLTGGGSPDESAIIVGDFSQLLIGVRTQLRLEASRVSGDSFKKLQVQVRAYLRADVQLAHGEAFSVRSGLA